MFNNNPSLLNNESDSDLNDWLLFDGVNKGVESSVVAVTSYALSGIDSLASSKRSCRLSDTKLAVVYHTSAGSTLNLRIFDCSGATPTGGTAVTIASASETQSRIDIKRISDTKLIVSYVNTSNQLVLKTYTISGTTLTLDATATSGTTSSGGYTCRAHLCVLSSTLALVTDIRNGSTNVAIHPIQIGSGTLTIDATNVLYIDDTTDINPQGAGYGLESLGDGSHAIFSHPPVSGDSFVVKLLRLTSYGTPPTVRATASSLDVEASWTYGIKARILVTSTTKAMFGVHARNGGVFGGFMLPMTINTATPAIAFDVGTDIDNLASTMVPYGFCDAGFLQNLDNGPLILVAGSMKRKGPSDCGNIVAMMIDGDDALQYKIHDFAGSDAATARDTEVIGLNLNKACVIQLAPTTQYPQIIQFNV